MIPQPGDFDISEILIHHSDRIDGQLERLQLIVSPSSKFVEALKSKQGDSFVSFLQQYDRSLSSRMTVPRMSDAVKSFPNEFLKDVIPNAAAIIDDIYNWVFVARIQLHKISEQSLDFNIQTNNLIAIHVCKLFITISKVCLFFHYFPPCRIIALMIDHYSVLTKLHYSRPTNELVKFITSVTASPFDVIKSMMKPIVNNLAGLVSLIGPYLIQIFGAWPIIDWQDFMIFDRKAKKQVESTLPSLSHMILMNLPVLAETVYLYSFVFPNIISKNPQFITLTETIFSDCPYIFITRRYKVDIGQLNETLAKTGSPIPKFIMKTIRSKHDNKNRISQIKRMKHIISLLSNILDVSLYNSEYLPKFIYDILPLAGFACYQIKVSLSKETVNAETAQLLSLIVELAKQFSKNMDSISRFFLFNLATIDAHYLDQLIENYKAASEEWQSQINAKIADISQQIKQLDLQEFDNGTRYDLTPMIVTIGRVFYNFNFMRATQRTSFLNSVFDHLMTILMHCKLMSSSLDSFLEICPIHKFWCFNNILYKYTEDFPGGIQTYASFISLTSFYNKDYICLSLNPQEQSRINEFTKNSRAKLLKSIQKMLNSYLKPETKFSIIINQNRFDKIFDPKIFSKYYLVQENLQTSDGNSYNVEPDSTSREKLSQLKELMKNLPGELSLGNEKISITDYIASNITNQLNFILFKNHMITPGMADSSFSIASPILWPMFSLLGISYPSKVLECKFDNNTLNDKTSFLDLIASIKTNEIPDNEAMIYKKIIEMFQLKLSQFITKDYVKTAFLPYGQRFNNIVDIGYKSDDFFSETGFNYLISSLGLHAGFILDRMLINYAASSMHSVFRSYTSISGLVNSWYIDFRNSGTAWYAAQGEKAVTSASNELIHLAVILVTRKMLRDAMSNLANRSMPGLIPILKAAFMRNPDRLSQKEDLIDEVVSRSNTYRFIELILETKDIQKASDPIEFFFFLALSLISPQFDDIKFTPISEILTYNLHIIPIAIDAFIHLLKCFVTSCDDKIISAGMEFYFSVLQRIVQKKRGELESSSKPSLTNSSINSLIILADIFPKYVKTIEYGRIGISFPYSVITEAYRELESEYVRHQIKKSHESRQSKKKH